MVHLRAWAVSGAMMKPSVWANSLGGFEDFFLVVGNGFHVALTDEVTR